VPEPVFEQYVEEVREQGRHDGKTELTTAGALVVARQYRSRHTPTEAVPPLQEQLGTRDRFDVADAAALPWAGQQRRPRRNFSAVPGTGSTTWEETFPTTRPGSLR
jgi:hypothetical protein